MPCQSDAPLLPRLASAAHHHRLLARHYGHCVCSWRPAPSSQCLGLLPWCVQGLGWITPPWKMPAGFEPVGFRPLMTAKGPASTSPAAHLSLLVPLKAQLQTRLGLWCRRWLGGPCPGLTSGPRCPHLEVGGQCLSPPRAAQSCREGAGRSSWSWELASDPRAVFISVLTQPARLDAALESRPLVWLLAGVLCWLGVG